jgi:putative PEP-CTERM system TPR-repeat lipoprotein
LQDKYQKVIDIVTPGYRGNDIEAQIQFLIGQAYLGLNQSHSANLAFTEALLLQEDFPMAQLGLAQVSVKQNKFDRAMFYVDEALKSYVPIPNAWIMKSMIFQVQGDNEKALIAINQALKISPKHMQALLNRASIYLAQGQYQKALPDVDFILKKIPLEPRAKYFKALINASLGDKKGSESKLDEIIVTLSAVPDNVMKNNPSYYYLAGVTNFQFGNLNDARRYLRSFLKYKDNDFSTLRLLAMIEIQQNEFLEAKSILTKANVYYPDEANILTLLGVVSLELGNVEAASQYFERVIVLVPNYSMARINLARSEMAAGDYQAAIQNLLSTEKMSSSGGEEYDLTLLLVQSYIKSDQFSKAIPLTKKLITQFPNNSFYQQQHGIATGLSGDIKGAKAHLLNAIELDEHNIQAVVHLARIDVVEKNFTKAIERLKVALSASPENIALSIEIGDIYQLNNDYAQAHIWYEKAYSFDNKNSFALKKLIMSYTALDNKNKAEEVLKNYLSVQPKDGEVIVMQGQLYLSMNKPHKAIKSFTAAVSRSTNRTDVYMHLANAQLMIDDRLGAIKSLNKAIALDDENVAPLMMLFPIILKQKDTERAKQLIFSIEKRLPNKPIAKLLSADLNMTLQQYKSAEKNYRSAYKIRPNQRAAFGLFQALSSQKHFKQAEKEITLWLKSNPDDVIAEIFLAESYSNQGRTEKVTQYYEALIHKYNRMPILLNNAANALYPEGDKALALSYAEEAYKKAPKNVDIVDTLAWIKSRNGETKQAISLFREALVIDFNNLEVKYHLALTLVKEGRQNEARDLLIEVAKSDRDFAQKNEAKVLLKQWLNK